MVGIVIHYAQYLIAKYLFVSKDGILVNNRYSYVYFKIIMLLIISISSTGGYFMFLHFSFYYYACWYLKGHCSYHLISCFEFVLLNMLG